VSACAIVSVSPHQAVLREGKNNKNQQLRSLKNSFVPSRCVVAFIAFVVASVVACLLACLPACLLACLLTQGNLQDHLQIRSVYRLKDGAVTLNSPFKAGSLLGQALIGAEYLLFQSVR
jgi:hypothetical protein